MFLADVFKQLFGQEANAANVTASFIMFFVGSTIVFIWEVQRRDKESPRTPEGFNWNFLFRDNVFRIILTPLIGFVFIMCGSTIMAIIGIQIPEAVGRFSPLFGGLLSDYISILIKRWVMSKEPKQ